MTETESSESEATPSGRAARLEPVPGAQPVEIEPFTAGIENCMSFAFPGIPQSHCLMNRFAFEGERIYAVLNVNRLTRHIRIGIGVAFRPYPFQSHADSWFAFFTSEAEGRYLLRPMRKAQ